jgi:hypothetical protein
MLPSILLMHLRTTRATPVNKRASGEDVSDKVLVDKRALIRVAFFGLTN